MTESTKDDYLDNFNLREELLRYLSFWPYILVSIIIFLISAFVYLRYANYEYQISAKIEIIDKAQDSEMSLPTVMTIFNRSMINLENEIGVLSSFNNIMMRLAVMCNRLIMWQTFEFLCSLLSCIWYLAIQ